MLRIVSADRSAAAPARRVLVVDDDVDVSLTLAALLEDLGCEVTVVHEGANAVARARALRPALVIMDLAMLRASPELEGARLVALSGYDGEEDRKRARAAGFDRHWVKPIDPDALGTLLQ